MSSGAAVSLDARRHSRRLAHRRSLRQSARAVLSDRRERPSDHGRGGRAPLLRHDVAAPKVLAARRFVIYKGLRPFPACRRRRAVISPSRSTARGTAPHRSACGTVVRPALAALLVDHVRDARAASRRSTWKTRNALYGPLLMAHDPSTFTPRAAACADAYRRTRGVRSAREPLDRVARIRACTCRSTSRRPFPLPPGLPWRF